LVKWFSNHVIHENIYGICCKKIKRFETWFQRSITTHGFSEEDTYLYYATVTLTTEFHNYLVNLVELNLMNIKIQNNKNNEYSSQFISFLFLLFL